MTPDETRLALESMRESERLVELGRWAEKYGVPALKNWHHDDSGMGACSAAFDKEATCTCSAWVAREALAALPKETP